jgi:hypothetical protein
MPKDRMASALRRRNLFDEGIHSVWSSARAAMVRDESQGRRAILPSLMNILVSISAILEPYRSVLPSAPSVAFAFFS